MKYNSESLTTESGPSPSTHETSQSHEIFDPHTLGIATATFYPTWSPELPAEGEEASPDKVRGDLALETIQAAIEQGYQIAVVDGGSSPAFQEALRLTAATVEDERERGMSASRRQAFESVSTMDGVEVICWTEPEKISMVRDCMELAVQPIVDGEADIVVTHRMSLDSYPDYQAEFETTSNTAWNGMLRRRGLLSENDPDLDGWSGPRIFRNDPEIVELFMDKYKYKSEHSARSQDETELWPNAIFLPIVAALDKGLRVKSVDVPYEHPAVQTANEVDSDAFRAKRARQKKVILAATRHLLHLQHYDGVENDSTQLRRF